MEIIDKAVQSIMTLVGTWMPVASQAKRETVYYDEGVILFFKERARESLALRDDIPDNVKTDLITFDTQHIDTIINLNAVRIGHLTKRIELKLQKVKPTSHRSLWRITSSLRMRSMWRIRQTL